MDVRQIAIASVTVLCLGRWNGSARAQPTYLDEPKTLKERLSNKASDEQRVDNCRVPPDRRGTTPRPDCDGRSDAKLTLAPPR